jgi:type I restriction enzyme M protein
LAKGYDPATLILEKRYQLGRGASGGKSDITVLRRTIDLEDQANAHPLLIIECKNWGREHDFERQKTLEEGGQLFGYLQQDRAAKHLCIYSSRLNNELTGESEIEYRCDIIHAEDTTEALEKFAKRERDENHTVARETVPLFQHAHNRESLHRAWRTTYDGAFQSTGIFEDRFTPYAIGYEPITKDLLREFNGQNGSTKVFNRFMEILRHNNVSDKENAFNRLCAIILAKLIDEEKASDAILDFQWFPEKDTAEDLIDRLQRLYKRGMKETLGEDITYFEERDIDYAFRAHRRDMAKKEVKRIFRALKFYTNSDFAFKEVHNQKLFEQNTQVVREIVELFQGYRLKYTSKQAFLGNLFELLLNSGFKQSEGQFFTPIPIARFMVRCLPLRERIDAAINRGDQHVIPRVMDYACGSAHFLTEIVEEIQEDLDALGREESVNTTWTRDYVWGIEKDYRLARTAKIAMFLHGAGDANILHEDGLDHLNHKLPARGTVDVLIANPPYSISSFKEHLGLQANQFSLLPFLTNTSSEIETLFVERAAQLLKVGGLASLILPSSILSNAGIYQRTRALLLNKFLIRGIVEMGGSAFIATGTNTVILFLERRPDTDADHFAIRADALFYEDKRPNDADFADSDLLSAYASVAGVNLADYLTWLSNSMGELPEALAQSSLFSAYISEFEALTATRNRRNQQSFKRLTEAEQEAEMLGKLLAYIREAEREKVFYFALAYAERLESGELVPQYTTIVRGAGNKAEEQAFLGYKWSQRRGSEGMVFLREPYDGGQLFTPEVSDRDESPDKAAYHLRAAFNRNEPAELPDDCPLASKLLVVPTPACLDFTRTTANLAINLSPKQGETEPLFETQYPLVPFNQIATLEYGKPLPERSRIEGEYPVMGSNGAVGTHNEYLIEGPAIIVGRKGSAGRIVYEERNCYPIDTTFYVVHNSERTELRYIQYLLLELNLEEDAKALGVPGLNRNDVYKKLVPLPPLTVQRLIVEEIESLEARAKTYVINDLEEQKRQILLDGLK